MRWSRAPAFAQRRTMLPVFAAIWGATRTTSSTTTASRRAVGDGAARRGLAAAAEARVAGEVEDVEADQEVLGRRLLDRRLFDARARNCLAGALVGAVGN